MASLERRPVRQWREGRIVFPHSNPSGKIKIINLYGRAIGRSVPKHLRHANLPGPKGVFNASALLQPSVYVCEGVFDALSLLAAGYSNVCALFGTYGLRWEWVQAGTLIFCIPGDALPEWMELHKVAVTVAKTADDAFKTVVLKTAEDNSQRFSLELEKQISAGHISYKIDFLRAKNDVEPSVPAGFSIRYNAEYMANILQLIKEMNGIQTVTVKLPKDDSNPIILESLALEALLMPIRRNR